MYIGCVMYWEFELLGVVKFYLCLFNGGYFFYGVLGFQFFDLFVVDVVGNVCVVMIVNGGIIVILFDGQMVSYVVMDDVLMMNVCFGGEGWSMVFVILLLIGCLVSLLWLCLGLLLVFG